MEDQRMDIASVKMEIAVENYVEIHLQDGMAIEGTPGVNMVSAPPADGTVTVQPDITITPVSATTRARPDGEIQQSPAKDKLKVVHACKHCGKQFHRKYRLFDHVNRFHQTGVTFLCEACDFKSVTRRAMKEHQSRKHTLLKRGKQCPTCQRFFPDEHYETHRLTHAMPGCEACSQDNCDDHGGVFGRNGTPPPGEEDEEDEEEEDLGEDDDDDEDLDEVLNGLDEEEEMGAISSGDEPAEFCNICEKYVLSLDIHNDKNHPKQVPEIQEGDGTDAGGATTSEETKRKESPPRKKSRKKKKRGRRPGAGRPRRDATEPRRVTKAPIKKRITRRDTELERHSLTIDCDLKAARAWRSLRDSGGYSCDHAFLNHLMREEKTRQMMKGYSGIRYGMKLEPDEGDFDAEFSMPVKIQLDEVGSDVEDIISIQEDSSPIRKKRSQPAFPRNYVIDGKADPPPPSVSNGVESVKLKFDGKFGCTVCNQGLSSQLNLCKHMLRHEASHKCTHCASQLLANTIVVPINASPSYKQSYSCAACGRGFNNIGNYKKHAPRCPSLKPGQKLTIPPIKKPEKFRCSKCPRSFFKKSDYDVHYRTHFGEKPYQCRYCSRPYLSQESCQNHMNICSRNPEPHPNFLCDICAKPFAHRQKYLRHKATHLADGTRPTFCCQYCGKQYTAALYRNGHEEICDLNPNKKARYVCDVCSKPFFYLHDFKIHYRTHSGEKPHVCKHCGRGFAQRGNRNAHERTCFQNPVPTPSDVICPTCGKTVCSKSALKDHERIHTGLKLFVCKICNKRFTISKHLRRHEKMHQSVIHHHPFACKFCGKTFLRKDNCKQHFKRVCSKRYGGNLLTSHGEHPVPEQDYIMFRPNPSVQPGVKREVPLIPPCLQQKFPSEEGMEGGVIPGESGEEGVEEEYDIDAMNVSRVEVDQHQQHHPRTIIEVVSRMS